MTASYRVAFCHFAYCNVQAGVSNDNIIPLFIKGSEQDPRMKNASQVRIYSYIYNEIPFIIQLIHH